LIEDCLEKDIYEPVKIKVFGAEVLFLYVRKGLIVADTFESLVFKGKDSRTKGAVGYRFIIRKKSLCLMNLHLEALWKEHVERNAQLGRILGSTLTKDQGQSAEKVEVVRDSDVLFLFGDLNYRVMEDKFFDKVNQNMTSVSDAKQHWDADQLSEQKKDGHFFGFEESYTHLPTYKYVKSRDKYDPARPPKYDPERTPAWTDRILRKWKKVGESTQGEIKVDVEQYAVTDYIMSDHRPIAASFNIDLREYT